MTLETWTVYLATVMALMSTPGPSQLLMLSNSANLGLRRSTLTAAGISWRMLCKCWRRALALPRFWRPPQTLWRR